MCYSIFRSKHSIFLTGCQEQQCKSIIPASWKLRQENSMFEFRPGYIVRPISENIYCYTRTFSKYSPLLCRFTNFQLSTHSLDPCSETSLEGNIKVSFNSLTCAAKTEFRSFVCIANYKVSTQVYRLSVLPTAWRKLTSMTNVHKKHKKNGLRKDLKVCVHLCVCVRLCIWVQLSPEPPGAGIIGHCELPYVCARKSNTCS